MLALITRWIFPGVREGQQERDARADELEAGVTGVSRRMDALVRNSLPAPRKNGKAGR